MSAFYGLDRRAPLDVLGAINTLQAWRTDDAIIVHARPDIILCELAGEANASNVPHFRSDLEALQRRAAAPDELELRDVVLVENGRIPIGVFAPFDGWFIRDLAKRVACAVPIAAGLALEVYRSYTRTDARTAVTREGRFVRCVLPDFDAVERSEAPTYAGHEPEISVHGRVLEAQHMLEAMAGFSLRVPFPDGRSEAAELVAADAFEAALASLAGDVDVGAGASQAACSAPASLRM